MKTLLLLSTSFFLITLTSCEVMMNPMTGELSTRVDRELISNVASNFAGKAEDKVNKKLEQLPIITPQK